VKNKMKRFLAVDHSDAFDKFQSAFYRSMMDTNLLATCLWIEEDDIESAEFYTDAEAIEEMRKHDVAFFIPKNWHEKNECEWIWVEKDEDPESDTFGEDLWCCMGVDDVPGLVARFMDYVERMDVGERRDE